MIKARTKSVADTRDLARSMAPALRSRDLVLLIGDIGAGKTTFTQGLGDGLGVDDPITSPTFVLLHSYEGRIPLHHVDIYRLEHLQEVIDLGLLELLDEGGVAVMEWGDLATPVLPRDYLEIRLAIDDDNLDVRVIQLRGVGAQWTSREPDVAACITQWATQQ